jgi:putative amino-acid transport system substrate-binding protein
MDRLSSVAVINTKHLPLQLAGKPFATVESAWPFLNNAKGKLLQQQVNQALVAMRKDGTLAAISNKWFHTDITQ